MRSERHVGKDAAESGVRFLPCQPSSGPDNLTEHFVLGKVNGARVSVNPISMNADEQFFEFTCLRQWEVELLNVLLESGGK